MKTTRMMLLALLTVVPTAVAGQQGPPQPPVPPQAPRAGAPVAPGVMARRQALRRRLVQGRMQRAPMAGRMQARRAPGQGFGPGMAPGMPGAPGVNGLLSPQMRERLKLTDAQVKRLEEVRIEQRNLQNKMQDDMRAERQRIEDMVRASRERLQAAHEKDRQAMESKVKGILTAEQQKQLEEMRQQRMPLMQPGQRMMMRRDTIK